MSSDHRRQWLTRRGFIGSGVAAGVAAPAILATAAGGPGLPVARNGSDDYLPAAEQAARWIRSAQVPKQQGIAWLADPDRPEKATTVGPDNTIYSGSAGIVLFFLELARATGDSAYLGDAGRGADYLAASWKSLPGRSGASFLNDDGLSFDQGLAGVAFTLVEVPGIFRASRP